MITTCLVLLVLNLLIQLGKKPVKYIHGAASPGVNTQHLEDQMSLAIAIAKQQLALAQIAEAREQDEKQKEAKP